MADENAIPRWLILPPVVGYAAGGLCIGAVTGHMFLPHLLTFERVRAIGAFIGWNLELADMIWFPAVSGGAIGLLAGLVGGPIASARAAQRARNLELTAETLGGRFSPEADAELSNRLSRDFATLDAAFYNVVHKDVHGARVAVGDLAITRDTGTDSNRSTRTDRQTAAYCMSDALRLPRFTLQPENVLLKLFSGMVGIKKIDFPGHPEFARIYHLSAAHAENARSLFDKRLLQHLGSRPGLHIESAPGSLLIYRPGRQYAPEELEAFIGDTAEIFRLFDESARKASVAAGFSVAPKADPGALAEQMPGIVGKMLREQLVTREELDAFVRQPAPRGIPANILRYCDKLSPTLVIVVGLMFSLVGAFFAFAFGLQQLPGMLFGLLFVAIGAPLAFFFGRSRLRTRRILRHGQLSAGKIEKIEDTGWHASGAGAISKLTVRYQARGQPQSAVCKVSGHAVERARRVAAERKLAPILYDPANSQRILFVEDLLNVSSEFE